MIRTGDKAVLAVQLQCWHELLVLVIMLLWGIFGIAPKKIQPGSQGHCMHDNTIVFVLTMPLFVGLS